MKKNPRQGGLFIMILQGSLYSQALDMETAVCFAAANDFTREPPRKVC